MKSNRIRVTLLGLLSLSAPALLTSTAQAVAPSATTRAEGELECSPCPPPLEKKGCQHTRY